MLANANKKLVITIELDKKDIKNLLRGKTVYCNSRHADDEPALIYIYNCEAIDDEEECEQCMVES